MTDTQPGANAEDCPQCPADVPYPFTCPGHAVAEVEVRPDVLGIVAAFGKVADAQGRVKKAFTEAAEAGTSAYQRSMQLAQGHDVPPLPVPTLPSHVDDLDSDTYDALRSRYAWLEQRHRDTVGSELAAINVRQAMEIGELRERAENFSARNDAARKLTNALLDDVSPTEPETSYGYRILAALDGNMPKETTT